MQQRHRSPQVGTGQNASILQSTHLVLLSSNLLFSLAGIAIALTLFIYGAGELCDSDKCLNKAFLTSTYYATPETDLAIGWPVATERILTSDAIVQPTQSSSWNWAHYYDCMASSNFAKTKCGGQIASSSSNYVACLKSTASVNTTLLACNAYSSAYQYQWPTPDQYLKCLSTNVDLEIGRYQTNLFKTCLKESMWPFYEVPQGVDSALLTGSFNWVIYLLTGLWTMVGFSVYAMIPLEEGKFREGQPQFFKRMGPFSALLVTLWQLTLLIVLIIITCRNSTVFNNSKNSYPMTGSTSLFTIAGVGIVFFYFLAEVTESWGIKFDGGKVRDFMKKFRLHSDSRLEAGPIPIPRGDDRGGYRIADPQTAMQYYLPPMIATYSDGYLLDCFILLGIVGATNQVTTDVAWNLLTLSFLYRLCNIGLARAIYEAFMSSPADHGEANQSKHNQGVLHHAGKHLEEGDSYLDIKVMAVGAQFAIWFLIIALSNIVFDKQNPIGDSSYVTNFFILGYIIPEVIRTCVHLMCQVMYAQDFTWVVYNVTQAVWLWDLAVRIVFCMMIYFSASVDTYGSRPFLQDKYYSLSQAMLVFGA